MYHYKIGRPLSGPWLKACPPPRPSPGSHPGICICCKVSANSLPGRPHGNDHMSIIYTSRYVLPASLVVLQTTYVQQIPSKTPTNFLTPM
jgi:hypothetical protein